MQRFDENGKYISKKPADASQKITNARKAKNLEAQQVHAENLLITAQCVKLVADGLGKTYEEVIECL